MNKKLLGLLIAVGVIFAGSVIMVIAGMHPPEQRIAEIVQDGTVLYTFDLNTAEDQTIRIDSGDSEEHHNMITIQNGEIFMSEADCPDQTCIRMGVLRSENLPIVCLPHKLVIRFAE